MSGPSRYDPSLDLDSGDLSIPGSMTSPQISLRATPRAHRRDVSSPTLRRTNFFSQNVEGPQGDVDTTPQAGPSRTHSARPPSPTPPSDQHARGSAFDRLGSQVKRSQSLKTRKQLPNLFTNTSAKSPLSATDRLGYSRRPGDPRPPPLITPEISKRVGRWVKEMVVCNFDLERGPVVERRIMGRRWGPGEKENVYVDFGQTFRELSS
jgi:hypothetical protein